jgi:hypothetical protein
MNISHRLRASGFETSDNAITTLRCPTIFKLQSFEQHHILFFHIPKTILDYSKHTPKSLEFSSRSSTFSHGIGAIKLS